MRSLGLLLISSALLLAGCGARKPQVDEPTAAASSTYKCPGFNANERCKVL